MAEYGSLYDLSSPQPAWYQRSSVLGAFAVAACVAVGLSMSSDKATAQYAVAAPATMTRQPVIGPGAVQYNKPVAARAQHVVSRATKPRFNNRFSTSLKAGEWTPTEKMPRKFIVGGNWKCNGDRASIKELVTALNSGETITGKGVEVVVAPPMLFGDYTRGMLRPDFGVAFQNCWVGGGGAFTGEVAADMIKDAGFDWVVLGHSERRSLPEIMETDEVVATKTAYAVEQGLKVMLCIGEQLEERQSGKTDEVNSRQLAAVADKLDEEDWADIVIAYEPVWAIGTGVVATPEQAQETHANIRAWLEKNVSPKVAKATRIMYGGSANAGNAEALAALPDVDGFLVGGASLKPEFLKVIDAWATKME